MNAQELINYIANSEKKTPVKLYIKEKAPIDYGDAKVFGAGDRIVLFYGSNTWAYTRLGRIELPEEEIAALLSGGDVTVWIGYE